VTGGERGPRRAFVLGSGVAGLSAAFGLAERGRAVTLLESRGWLGGRAFSFVDRGSGARLDNGPHVMIGCYRAMRALLLRLGTADRFQQDASLALAYRTAVGELRRLRLLRLPVPLAMPLALLGLRIGIAARARAALGMVAVLRGAPADWTLAEWLRRRRQHGAPAAFLWRPLCRAIMNVEPELASAAAFTATLREAFTGSAATAAFWAPKRPWGEILGDPAPAALAAAGVQVRTSARVVGFEWRDGAVAALVLGSGERVDVRPDDCVIAALPWHALAALLPGRDVAFARLAPSPIVSAHVAIDPAAPALPDDGPVTALVDGEPFHFVLRQPGADVRSFALLAGGNRVFDGMEVAAIEAAARAQLARHYRGFDAHTPAHVRITKEAAATFVDAPGTAAARPAPGHLRDGPSNLFVCGDWTQTGLPATLEGAARSAQMLLAREFGG
jgi:squalene-associated FAD-dependent desaturase